MQLARLACALKSWHSRFDIQQVHLAFASMKKVLITMLKQTSLNNDSKLEPSVFQ